MILSKKHEGKDIFAIGTGNNARREKGKIIEFHVVKVKIKYAELQEGIYRNIDNYCIETGATQSAINSGYSGNAGYKFFEDKEEIAKYFENIEMNKQIREFIGYHKDFPFHKSTRILSILKEDD